jgi:nucleoside-diphosphate-sugar epimerase
LVALEGDNQVEKVLITGGAGFIGAHLAHGLIKNGAEVHLLDNFSRGKRDRDLEALLEHPFVTMLNIDMMACDVPYVDYDVIYHLAAIIGVSNVLEKPFEVLRANVELTLRSIEWAKAQRSLRRFLFASSSEVYAGTLKYFSIELPTPEATALTATDLSHPRTSYMLSKIYGEALVMHSGLPYTIFRPHNVYGPRMGMAHVIPELLQKAYKLPPGGTLSIFSPKHTRTFCYIDDAVFLLRKMAEAKECQCEVLNLGQQAPEITIEHLATVILKVLGKTAVIEKKEDTPGSPARRCPNMEKASSLLGSIQETSLEDGIGKTFEWYKETFF